MVLELVPNNKPFMRADPVPKPNWPVDGLKVIPTPLDKATPEPPFTGENNKKCEAFVPVEETVFTLVAVVATPVNVP